MASTVISNHYRRRMADFHAGLPGAEPLAPFAFMAFGDAGHHPDFTPKIPDPEAPGLAHEVLRVPLHAATRASEFTVECEGRIERGELVGVWVSEVAVLDADGRLVAIKTFAPKIREADELYQVFVEPLF